MGFGPVIDALRQRDRAKELATSNQLLLGEIILLLERAPKDAAIIFDTGEFPGRFRSWRGRYNELALSFDGDGSATVGDLLAEATAAVGKIFQGYKGGDYTMGRGTPLWMANYGDTSHDYDSNCYRMLTGARAEDDGVVITTALTECY